jgi:hypothetical protein
LFHVISSARTFAARALALAAGVPAVRQFVDLANTADVVVRSAAVRADGAGIGVASPLSDRRRKGVSKK